MITIEPVLDFWRLTIDGQPPTYYSTAVDAAQAAIYHLTGGVWPDEQGNY